jgi:hypothetical protein
MTMTLITIETEALQDTANELIILRRILASRHGEPFRALDRRLEALPALTLPTPIHPLHSDDGSCQFMVQPPQEWTDILIQARALGVLV